MSENTHANVETEALEQDVTQEEQVETKQEKTERTFTRAEIGKMLAAERAKWEDEQAEIIEQAKEQAKSEGERLAKMTKDERAKEEEARRIQAIEERERVLAEKEMRVATQTLLSEEGLPVEFLDFVISETAEVTKEKIGLLRSVFDKAVESRVDERLAQKAPRKGTGPVSLTKAEIMAVEDDDQRQALIAANIGLFKN
nr:MAG TPA: capsid scaffolding protein [Caudoviricetes sp.]